MTNEAMSEIDILVCQVLQLLDDCASQAAIGTICERDERLAELFQAWCDGMNTSRFSALVSRLSDA